MDKYFTLTDQQTEDKIVQRQQRVFADILKIEQGDEYTVKTTSLATRQKIKFFVDVAHFYDDTVDPIVDSKIRIGKYFELEHWEQGQHNFSKGALWFTYLCTENNGNGEFTFSIKTKSPIVTLYVSNVVLEDSFYNPSLGWLNPDNPNKIPEDEIDDEGGIVIDPNPNPSGGKGGGTVYYNINHYLTASEQGRYYPIYTDDLIEIAIFRVNLSTVYLSIIPQGVHQVVPNDPYATHKGNYTNPSTTWENGNTLNLTTLSISGISGLPQKVYGALFTFQQAISDIKQELYFTFIGSDNIIHGFTLHGYTGLGTSTSTFRYTVIYNGSRQLK